LSEKNKIGLFDDSGHLTDEAIALCVEAMMSSAGKNKLPENIKTHLTQCDICNDRVIDLYRDVKDEPEVIRRLQIQSGRAKKTSCFQALVINILLQRLFWFGWQWVHFYCFNPLQPKNYSGRISNRTPISSP